MITGWESAGYLAIRVYSGQEQRPFLEKAAALSGPGGNKGDRGYLSESYAGGQIYHFILKLLNIGSLADADMVKPMEEPGG